MTQTCKIVIRDEVWCIITGLRTETVDLLWNKFGIYVEGYRYMPAFTLGRWDGKIRFFERTGKTYVRLLDKIIPYLEEYDVVLDDHRRALSSPSIAGSITKRDSAGMAIEAVGCNIMGDIEIGGKPFTLRPYQLDAILTAIEVGSGYIVAGTGAGKCLGRDTLINVKVEDSLYEVIINRRELVC